VNRAPAPRDVGIIGGGYAGMAAAVALARLGIPVVVYEASRQLGGRARAVEIDQTILDNGQHLLIGAYRETLALLDLVGTPRTSLLRMPLRWHVLPRFEFRAARLPAPLHLAVGLLRARGIGLAARFDCVRFLAWCRRNAFRLERDMTVDALLRRYAQDPQLVRMLWEPLCVAALNTPSAEASAQVFLAVLRDGLAAQRSASDLLLPRVDLTSLFPDPAAHYVRERGGDVRLGTAVTRVQPVEDGYVLATNRGETKHAAAIIATQPYRVPDLAGDIAALAGPLATITAMRYQPIVTVYLRYAAMPGLPLPMTGLSAQFTQWIFDRAAIGGQAGLIAAVISTRGRQQDLTHADLAQRVHDEIAVASPGLPSPLWSRVIEEKRATFACTPDLPRPDQATALPGLTLAGDYTASEYPATIEAAVRSGLRCAALAAAHLGAAMP